MAKDIANNVCSQMFAEQWVRIGRDAGTAVTVAKSALGSSAEML
jgi:hypothetical protein